MKKNTIILFPILISLSLVACSHSHTFSSDWSNNDTHHWHAATCEHEDMKNNYEEHTFGAYVIVNDSTENDDGLEQRTCEVCLYTQDHVIPAKGHTHTYEEEFSYNSTHHWKQAICEHEDEVSEYGEHNFTDWVFEIELTSTQDGVKERHCNACSYSEREVVYAEYHEHRYSENYTYDRNKHWRKATCGHDVITDEADHDFNVETTVEDGKTIKKYTCKVCNYKYTTTSGDVTTPWTLKR